MKLLRSSANANARRKTGLSKGGASRLTKRLVLALAETRSQTACGACVLISFSSGTVTS